MVVVYRNSRSLKFRCLSNASACTALKGRWIMIIEALKHMGMRLVIYYLCRNCASQKIAQFLQTANVCWPSSEELRQSSMYSLFLIRTLRTSGTSKAPPRSGPLVLDEPLSAAPAGNRIPVSIRDAATRQMLHMARQVVQYSHRRRAAKTLPKRTPKRTSGTKRLPRTALMFSNIDS